MIRNGNANMSEQTAVPSKYPQGKFKDKGCRWCGEMFSPNAPSHFYCSDTCKDLGNTDRYYRNTYGIGYVDFLVILEEQDFKCAICGGEGFKFHVGVKEKLVLDHCHITGVVRGALCHNCNRALGLFKDSVASLKQAAIYLEK